MDLYNLSTPAFIYLIIAVFGNVISLFILPFSCNSIGFATCMIILLLSMILTVVFIYLVTWAIDALYQSEYIILSWVLAIVVILFSLIDLASFFGNVRLDHSSNDQSETQDEASVNNNVQYDNHSITRGNTITSSSNQGNTTLSSFITSPITSSFYSDYTSNVASNPYGN